MASPKQRMAGTGLLEWAQTPMGEEVLEGVAGGLLAGLPMFFQDNDPAQSALATATAIAGGIGMGMAGRRIGRHIGSQVQGGALKDQAGLPAMLGRTLGQETMGEAMAETGKMMRGQVADYLVKEQATKMRAADLVSAADLDKVMALRQGKALVDMVQNAPPEARERLMKALDEDLARLAPIEQQLVEGAAASMDDKLRGLASMLEREAAESGTARPSSFISVLESMTQGPAKPVTGGDVGAAIGRLAGDEIGVLMGLGGGMLLGQQLGLQTPKDVEIARLRDQLAAQGMG